MDKGGRKINVKIYFLFLILFFLTITACVKTEDREVSRSASDKPALSSIYNSYEFGSTESIINIGTQPLYFPTGLITEVMKHDLILKEMLAEEGFEIRFHPFLKGNDVNHFLKSGDLDAGVGGDMPAISAVASMDIIVPIMIQQGFISIIATEHMLLKDLKGRSIAFAYGSNAHYALLNSLNSGGVKESQVNLVPMEVTAMADALKNGEIDAFSAWEPTPFLTLKKYAACAVIHRSLSSGYLYFSKSFYDKHKIALLHILAAELRAINWMHFEKQNLLRSGELVLESILTMTDSAPDLTKTEIGDLAMEDILRTSAAPSVPENYLKDNGSLHNEFIFLKKIRKIEASKKWEDVRNSFDRKILQEVNSDPEKYRFNEFRYSLDGEKSE